MGEIGSFYEENKMLLDKPHHNSLIEKCIHNGYRDYCMLSCGREGFMMALSNIMDKKYDAGINDTGIKGGVDLSENRRLKCLLPMYTCDTVVMPFEHYDCELAFYPVGKNLRPDREKFMKLIRKEKPEVIVIHSYYGVDTMSELRDVLKTFSENGGIIIEDLTQCYYMALDYVADYYVVALRKWSGITDGGLVISKTMLKGKPDKERMAFVKLKQDVISKKTAYLDNLNADNYETMQAVKRDFLSLNNEAEELLDLDLSPHRMSEKAFNALELFDLERARKVRAENALFLTKEIELEHPIDYTGVESPIYFPVYVKEREKFQQFMRSKDIFVPVLWLYYESIGLLDDSTRYIYDNILALPCDHRYSCRDMERMANVVREWRQL